MLKIPAKNLSADRNSQFIAQFGDTSRIPSGWQRMTFKNACTLVNGKAFKPTDWSKSGVPIVRIQNLNDNMAEYNYFQGVIEDKYRIDTGSLLFAWSGTPGTSFGAFIWNNGPAVLNQHIFHVHPCSGVDKMFLKCTFDGRIDEIIKRAHGGVGLRHITKQELEQIDFLLPPLPLQLQYAHFVQQSDKSKFAAVNVSNLNLSLSLDMILIA